MLRLRRGKEEGEDTSVGKAHDVCTCLRDFVTVKSGAVSTAQRFPRTASSVERKIQRKLFRRLSVEIQIHYQLQSRHFFDSLQVLLLKCPQFLGAVFDSVSQ